jgi:hypothetical protein
LLVGGVGDVLDVFLELEEWCGEELREDELLTVVWDIFRVHVCHFNDLVPMTWSNGWLGESLDEGNDLLEVFNLLLELLVGIPGTEDFWKFRTILTESLNLIRHV